jgi:hypothetical protein
MHGLPDQGLGDGILRYETPHNREDLSAVLSENDLVVDAEETFAPRVTSGEERLKSSTEPATRPAGPAQLAICLRVGTTPGRRNKLES